MPGLARRVIARGEVSIEGDTLKMLDVSDAFWREMRTRGPEAEARPVPAVVRRSPGVMGAEPDFDVVVCGGTMGIIAALALQRRGHRVCVVERRLLEGRTQEWNTSRHELHSLAREGLLAEAELEACVVSDYGRVRVGFKGGEDVWADGVLDIGVSPAAIIAALKREFEGAGGTVMERTAFRSAEVRDDGVVVKVAREAARERLDAGDMSRPHLVRGDGAAGASAAAGPGPSGRAALRARLMIDCMGHYSPVVKQLRGNRKPEGTVMVVGGCHEGTPPAGNETGDLLYTFGDSFADVQMYWEAFPAEGGRARTTYMFTYCDAHASRPSLEGLLDHYMTQLPTYQGTPLEELDFKRVLFGAFPAYSDGPLRPGFDRVVQIGDSSASQSPLSFGGFGSMLRHLPRLSRGLSDALSRDRLSRGALAMLHPYQPSLSLAWLYQRSMALPPGSLRGPPPAPGDLRAVGKGLEPPAPVPRGRGFLRPGYVNRLLKCSFGVQSALGDAVMRPFLQDTIQFVPLSLTMAGMMFRDPLAITQVGRQVGARTMAAWFGHKLALLAYTVAHLLVRGLRRLPGVEGLVRGSYWLARVADALEWGSGLDNRGGGGRGGAGRAGGAAPRP